MEVKCWVNLFCPKVEALLAHCLQGPRAENGRGESFKSQDPLTQLKEIIVPYLSDTVELVPTSTVASDVSISVKKNFK